MKSSDLKKFQKLLKDAARKPMKSLLKKKKRVAWQIGLLPTKDKHVLAVTAENASPFYATRLLVMPRGFVGTAFLKNGSPWLDCVGKPIDEAFFLRWKTSHAFMPESVKKAEELDIAKNGIRLVVKKGDRIEVHVRWGEGGRAPKLRGIPILGFVEEEAA